MVLFRWLRSLLLCFAIFSSASAHANPFPLPDELRPDVDFWVSIFTDITSDEGVLHDNRSLGVVYERIDMPATTSRRERNRLVDARRKLIADALRTLATGKRENLTALETQVLGQWPAGTSNADFKRAASRIRYQHGLSDRFLAGIERSGRWRNYVEQQMTSRGVPADLVALPHVESSYNLSARSHVGASGIWQFTRSTGRRFMRIDHVLDERNDPFVATESASRLLAYNYSITGNWPMAITAYNHGLGGVRRAMREFGDDALVDILRSYKGRTFGFASRNFYVAFLAAREVDQNPEKYFDSVRYADPDDYSEHVLPGYLSVANIAEATGVSRAELAAHNLAWQPTIWQGSKHVPKGEVVRLPSALVSQPLAAAFAGVSADAWQDQQLPDMFHRIGRGDTLSGIATTYKTSVSELMALNNLRSSHRIRAGQQLRLPAAGPLPTANPSTATRNAAVEAAVVAATTEVPGPIVELEPASLSDADKVTADETTALLSDPSDYTVRDDGSIEIQPQETLGHYADWLGIRTQRLRDINGLAFRTPVEVGNRLKLDMAQIGADQFESKRVAYHRDQQDAFFREHRISGVAAHTIRRGESIWILALREYNVPVWLFRQYNPELDVQRIQPGTVVQMPLLTDATD